MAADITTTLASWSSTAASNQPDYADAVGPNNLADNLRVVQAVVRDAVAGDGTIVSAATTDLSTVNASYINVTGSTGPITSLGTLSAGIVKILKFASTPTLTHNATSLILPGAANITAVAGDIASFRSEGSGNWRCLWYQKTNGILVIAAAKTVTFNNTLTFAGTDGTTMTFPGTSATIARTDAANTFTGLQTFSTGITSTAASNTLGSATVSGTWTGSGSPTFTSMGSWSGTTGTFSGNVGIGLTPSGTTGFLLSVGANDASNDSLMRVSNTNASATRIAAVQMTTGASANVWQMFARNGNLFWGVSGVADYMQLTSTGINSTAIGATTASTGAFTTLSASGAATFGTTADYTMTINASNSGSSTISSEWDGSGNAARLRVQTKNAAGTLTDRILFQDGTTRFYPDGTERATLTSSAFSTTLPFTALSGTAIPAGGTAGSGFKFSSTSNFGVFFGSGAPTLSAGKGSLYLRSDGTTTNNRAYINTDGGTTWTAVTTVA